VSTNSRSHYKPFGDSIEAPKDYVGYTGHKFDTDLGWSYMQQRYLGPIIGRIVSNDSVGYVAKNPVMSFNRYMYVNNNPYKFTDPTGMCIWDLCIAETAVAVTLVNATVFTVTVIAAAYAGSEAINAYNENSDGDREANKPAFGNSKEAEKAANELGYTEDKGSGKIKGEKIFENKKAKGDKPKYISRDTDGHTGGAFKGADKAKDLSSNKTRKGTYDKELKKIAK
jgi:RHS repeat-associated protein